MKRRLVVQLYIVNEKLDSGNIIVKKVFFIESNDDEVPLKKLKN